MASNQIPKIAIPRVVAGLMAIAAVIAVLTLVLCGTDYAQSPQTNQHGATPFKVTQKALFGSSGSSLFWPVVTYDSGGLGADALAVGDVNGDGRPDLVVTNADSNSVGVLLGNGNGTFQEAYTYKSGGLLPWSVAIQDVNGDGKPDLVLANFCAEVCNGGSVSVFLGNGDGTFQEPIIYSSGGFEAFSIAVGDVNGDGKPDLVVADWCESAGSCSHGVVAVLLNNGDGTFRAPVIYDSGGWQAYSVVIGKVQADGHPSLVVGNRCQSISNCSNGGVSVLLGNGDGTFRAPISYNAGGAGTESVVIGDVNGDGIPDLVAVNDLLCSTCLEGGVSVLLGNADGSFRSAVGYDSGGTKAFSVTIGDLNGDGHSDLVVANVLSNSVGVLLGNGDGSFQSAVTYDSGGNGPYYVAVADVNGDHKLDLLVANCSGGFCGAGNGEGVVGVLLNSTAKSGTSTRLASSLNPSTYGQRVILSAKVTTTGAVAPTGSVVFTWQYFTETFTIGSAILNSSGLATLVKTGLNADTYPLTADYRGDINNLASTSPVLNQTVLPTTSAATITSSPNPSTLGQAVTFTAKITSPTVMPAGPVTFTAGTRVLGTEQLSGGKVTFTTSSLAAGSTRVTVTYYGDSNIAKSSASVTQTIRP